MLKPEGTLVITVRIGKCEELTRGSQMNADHVKAGSHEIPTRASSFEERELIPFSASVFPGAYPYPPRTCALESPAGVTGRDSPCKVACNSWTLSCAVWKSAILVLGFAIFGPSLVVGNDHAVSVVCEPSEDVSQELWDPIRALRCLLE